MIKMFKSRINQIIIISSLCLVVISMGLFLTAGSYSRALKLVNNYETTKVTKDLNVLLKENTYLESNGSISANQKSIFFKIPRYKAKSSLLIF